MLYFKKCSSDEYESTSASATNDRVCTKIGSCGQNSYDSNTSTSKKKNCTPLTTCSADEYEAVAATSTSDRTCEPLSKCTQDEFEQTPPTLTSDRKCQNSQLAPLMSLKYLHPEREKTDFVLV